MTPFQGAFRSNIRSSRRRATTVLFTLINPLRYAIDLVHHVYLEGAGLDRLVPDLGPMAIIAAVTLGAAAWMFRNRLE